MTETNMQITMCEAGGLNYYDGTLDLEQIVRTAELSQQDEALHVVDLSSIVDKYRFWQRQMPRVEPHYAVKCNDDPIVVQTLAKLGASFDCASKTEIKQVLDMGVPAERIIFAQPCKPVSHLEYAQEQNVNLATADTEFEIYKTFEHFPDMNLVVRFRCEAKEAQCPLGDKFGCKADSDVASLMMLARSLRLNVSGTSFHVGSGCRDLSAYKRAIKCSRNVFNLGQLLGYNMNLVDIGGGFPGSDETEFLKVSDIINRSLERYFPNPDVRIIAEPGRYFVAAAYTLICKIHARREVRSPNGKIDTIMYYVNDGVYGSFNCILYDHQHVTAVPYGSDIPPDAPTFKSLIWGPTCDALDKIIENIYLPSLSCGDYLAFPNMGAYTVPVASPFNGFKLPKMQYYIKRSDAIELNL